MAWHRLRGTSLRGTWGTGLRAWACRHETGRSGAILLISRLAEDPAAIIIFGAALRPDGTPTLTLTRRVEAALRFGERLPIPPLYVPTGGIGRYPPAEAVAMATLLRRHGIAPDRIIVEDTARDTLQSVRLCADLLRRRQHAGPVHAASSAYHLPRCLILLRLARVPASPVPPPPQAASHRFLRRWRWRLREVPAIPWDVLTLTGKQLVDRFAGKR